MRFPSLALLLALAIVSAPFSPPAYGETSVDTGAAWEVRSVPVIGFFPMGGDRDFRDIQVGSYAVGPSLDFVNYNYSKSRLTLLNASFYLLGLSWNSLQPEASTELFSLGYARVGPHYQWSGLWGTNLSFGSQFGYGILLQGDTAQRETRLLHGLDISFTITWTGYEQPTAVVPAEVGPLDGIEEWLVGAIYFLGGTLILVSASN